MLLGHRLDFQQRYEMGFWGERERERETERFGIKVMGREEITRKVAVEPCRNMETWFQRIYGENAAT